MFKHEVCVSHSKSVEISCKDTLKVLNESLNIKESEYKREINPEAREMRPEKHNPGQPTWHPFLGVLEQALLWKPLP